MLPFFNWNQFNKEIIRSQTTASKLTFFSFPKLAIAEDTTKHYAQNQTSTKVTKLSTPINSNMIHTTSININIENKKTKHKRIHLSAQKKCLSSNKNRKNAGRVRILPFSSGSTTQRWWKRGRTDIRSKEQIRKKPQLKLRIA